MPGVNDWLAKATSDLKSSRKLIKDDDETLDSAAYFTQQSTEKALKSYLIFKKQPIPRTHDLEKLLANCMKFDSSFNNLLEDSLVLSPFAVYSRYPDDRFFIEQEEVIEAIKRAKKILRFVKNKMEPVPETPQLKIF